MFSLLFLICNETACVSVSPPDIFQTKEQCESVGYSLLEQGQKDIQIGEVQPHRAIFKCLAWGTPA